MVSVPTVLVCLAAAFFVVQQVLLKFVAHPAINGCLDKQRAAILNFQPDVVVGMDEASQTTRDRFRWINHAHCATMALDMQDLHGAEVLPRI